MSPRSSIHDLPEDTPKPTKQAFAQVHEHIRQVILVQMDPLPCLDLHFPNQGGVAQLVFDLQVAAHKVRM